MMSFATCDACTEVLSDEIRPCPGCTKKSTLYAFLLHTTLRDIYLVRESENVVPILVTDYLFDYQIFLTITCIRTTSTISALDWQRTH